MEHQCYSNAQYSRCEKLEISGIPTITKDTDIENQVLDALTKIDVTIDLLNDEACH